MFWTKIKCFFHQHRHGEIYADRNGNLRIGCLCHRRSEPYEPLGELLDRAKSETSGEVLAAIKRVEGMYNARILNRKSS